MKKKKLKKKIKKLEETLNAQHTILKQLRDRISTLDDSIDKKDQSYKSEFGTIKHGLRETKNKVDTFDSRINILQKRTEIDYSSFARKEEPKCSHQEEHDSEQNATKPE